MMLSQWVSESSDFDACRHNIEQKLAKTVGNDIRSGECYNKLARLDNGNASILINYVLVYKHESDVEDSTLTTGLLNLLRFAIKVSKPFGDITYEDVIGYLDYMKNKEPGSVRWKRTSNVFNIHITRFFKWFYSPDVSPKKRRGEDNLGRVKIKGKTYKLTDMCTLNDNEVFFKYCPDPKIKCYHAMAADTGAQPAPCTCKCKDTLPVRDLDIRKNGVYFDGSNTTNRILDVLEENPGSRLICIDELDKMPRTFQNQLLNFMESGRVKVDQQKKQYDFQGAKVFVEASPLH